MSVERVKSYNFNEMDVMTDYNQMPVERVFSVERIVSAFVFEPLGKRMPSHWERYDFAQVFYVMEGSATYTTKEGVYHFGERQMIYRPAFEASKLEWAPGDNHLVILSFVSGSSALRHFQGPPITLYGEESASLMDLAKTGVRISEPLTDDDLHCGYRLKDNIPPVALSYVATSLERFFAMVYCRRANIDVLLNENQKVNKFINDRKLVAGVKGYLAANISQRLTIDEIAEHFGTNPTTLMKQFKADTNMSIIEYYINLKIKAAKRLINESSMNFTEISEALGFTSVNYFSKTFKAKTGLSPTEYSHLEPKRRAYNTC